MQATIPLGHAGDGVAAIAETDGHGKRAAKGVVTITAITRTDS